MDKKYDVVVAGAGPAGLQTARDIAARDYNVLLLEAEDEERFPSASNKSTAGTFSDTMTGFGVPDNVVQNVTDYVILESQNEYLEMEHPGYVLDFEDFKNWLAEDLQEKEGEIRYDARVNSPKVEDGEVEGILHNGGEEVKAEIVIDATGPAATLTKQLDVNELPKDRQAVGIEYEMENVEVDAFEPDLTDTMMFNLDHSYAPGGYSWIFHTGEDTAKVGICYLMNESFQSHGDDRRLDEYLEKFIEEDPRLQNAERIEGETHRGSAHITHPDNLIDGSFMAVGDTVSSLDPVWGEGIGNCMKSGRAAAITADQALRTGETSEEQLSLYRELWEEEVAPEREKRMAMTELMYLMSNERFDRLLNDLDNMDVEELSRLNSGHPTALINVAEPGDLKTVAKWAGIKAEENNLPAKAKQSIEKAEQKVESWLK